MASESAVLGVPAIYAASTGRGYTDEQERRYGLVFNLREIGWRQIESIIEHLLELPIEIWKDRRRRLLEDTIDVASYVADVIESMSLCKS